MGIMVYILVKGPKLWDLWYIPYYGYCRISIISRSINNGPFRVPARSTSKPGSADLGNCGKAPGVLWGLYGFLLHFRGLGPRLVWGPAFRVWSFGDVLRANASHDALHEILWTPAMGSLIEALPMAANIGRPPNLEKPTTRAQHNDTKKWMHPNRYARKPKACSRSFSVVAHLRVSSYHKESCEAADVRRSA